MIKLCENNLYDILAKIQKSVHNGESANQKRGLWKFGPTKYAFDVIFHQSFRPCCSNDAEKPYYYSVKHQLFQYETKFLYFEMIYVSKEAYILMKMSLVQKYFGKVWHGTGIIWKKRIVKWAQWMKERYPTAVRYPGRCMCTMVTRAYREASKQCIW